MPFLGVDNSWPITCLVVCSITNVTRGTIHISMIVWYIKMLL